MDILSLIISLAFIKNTTEIHVQEVKQQEVVLDYFVDRLAMCESENRENIKTLDSNNKYSYGIVQFQEDTWKNALRKYGYFPEAEDSELMNHIYDGKLQKEVAKKMIQDGGWRHWKNCATKIGIDKFIPIKEK